MAYSSNENINSFLQVYSDRSTLQCMLIAKTWTIPPEPVCYQEYEHEVGDIVVATGLGQIKAGVQMEIKAKQRQATGYVNYYAGGVWHNQGDIAKVGTW